MKRNQKIEINGYTVNYSLRTGDGEKFICFLHGYPTSSADYAHLISQVDRKYSVVSHDHLGFGRSAKPVNYSYALKDQALIALALYKNLGARNIHLVAHDYGTSVATELIALHNEAERVIDLKSVTLCNGSMLIEMAELRLIQRLLKSKTVGPLVARLSSAGTFHRNMKNIWFNKELYDQKAMQVHWDLLISDGGRKVLSQITSYIDQRYQHYDRWIGGLKESELPFHILWAANDPVAVVGMAHKLGDMIINSTKSIIEECGHYPMIEKEVIWLSKVINFVESIE